VNSISPVPEMDERQAKQLCPITPVSTMAQQKAASAFAETALHITGRTDLRLLPIRRFL
jgi:hypothetical protein